MHCKTNIQYISGYDRSIQIYDIMAISFATASIKRRKMITVKQDANLSHNEEVQTKAINHQGNI